MNSDRFIQELAAIHTRLDVIQRRLARFEKHQEKQQASIGWLTKRWAAMFLRLKRRAKK